MKLGANLISTCKARGWSLARLARVAGVPTQTLHGWTVGRNAVNLKQLKQVAQALELPIHKLVYGEADPFEPQGEQILKEIFSGDVRVTLHRIERKGRLDL